MSPAVHEPAPAPQAVPAGSPWNVPNLITISRLVLAIALFTLMDLGVSPIGSAILFAIAAGTDFLDGMIARRYGLVTVLGRILDPFVDKVIIIGAFVFLLPHKDSGMTATIAMIVIGRELLVTTLRSWFEQQGRDFSAVWSGKIKMVLQSAAVVVCLLSLDPALKSVLGSGTTGAIVRDVILWTAVASTVYSGAIYVVRASELVFSRSQV